ncbi:MAG: DUF4270 family protein [Cytophagales bacterium]|nr:MAG: DUF4270 family protein [Cytophagales bacterium]
MIKNIVTSGLLLAASLFFFACDDATKLGLDIQRTDQRLNTLYTDTFTVESSVKILDTINTTASNTSARGLIGKMTDSKFGTAEAMAFGSFLLPTDGISFLDDQKRPPIYDSLDVLLDITYAYGDTSQAVKLNVHRLKEPILSNKYNYYNTDKLPIGELVGTASVKVKAGTAIRIRLSDQLGREIIDRNGADDLKIQANFDQFFKGLRFSAEGIDNLVFGFDPNSANFTRMRVFYRNELTETTSKIKNLYFTGVNGAGSLFTNIQTDFSKSPSLSKLTKGQFLPTSQLGNQGYIMGGAGVVTLLKFPSVYGFNKDNNVVINRAELVMEPTDDNFFNVNNRPIPSLNFIRADANGNIDRYVDTSNSSGLSGVPKYLLVERGDPRNPNSVLFMYYLESGRTYQPIVITSYIQALMNQTIDNTGLLVLPQRFFSTTSLEKITFGDSKSPTKPMKLIIYYTLINR